VAYAAGSTTTNAPQTDMSDRKQYVLEAGGDSLFAFSLY
jgi:hypothetical protein